EADVEPQPEVDLIRDPDAECAVAPSWEAVQRSPLTVDLHPPSPRAGLLHVVHVDDGSTVHRDVHREEFPHGGSGGVMHLPLDARPVGLEIEAPVNQGLDAGPAHWPG